jgi:hypothetical protein
LDTSVQSIAAGEPVVIDGNMDIVENDVTVNAFIKTQTVGGYILDEEGKSVVAAEEITPFTYIFSEAFNIEDEETSLNERPAPSRNGGEVYDLTGRKVQGNSSPFTLHSSLSNGVYIVNGKKVLR